MTVSLLRRPDADDAALLRRARRGDRRAQRLYTNRHAERAVTLVDLLTECNADSTRIASVALSAAVADGVAGDDAMLRCAARVAAPVTTELGLARLAVALTDGDGRTEEAVAALLDRTTTEVAEMRALAYAEAGQDVAAAVPRECRGWPLVARKDRLTSAEREAADGHLALCRQCRARLDQQRQARDKIWVRGGAVSAVVLADVVSLPVPGGSALAGTGVASAMLGKAGMAVVGAGAIAITATSAGVAVARTAPSQPHGTQAPAVAPRLPGSGPGSVTKPPRSRSGDPRVTGSHAGGGAATNPPTRTQSTVGKPLPNDVPTSVPVPLPSSVPIPLPTSLPALHRPLPTPTVSMPVSFTAAPLPLPTVGALLGH
jgi:hypothetical protein